MSKNFTHPNDSHIDAADMVGHPREAGSCEAVAILRPPYLPPEFSDGMCMVAADCRTFAGPASEISNDAIAIHLGVLIGRIPPSSLEDYKLGAVICDHLGLGISPEWLAEILGLKKVDWELKRALEAALCGVLATTVGPVDLATIVCALGTLVHAHPCFSDVVKEAIWKHPFGEDTAYRMAYFGVADSVDDSEADACTKKQANGGERP